MGSSHRAAPRRASIATFLVLALALAVAACSGKQPVAAEPEVQAAAPEPAPAATQAPAPGPASDSVTVTATGFAEGTKPTGALGARESAIRNAKRNAVEQGLGTLVKSSTLTENFQVVNDKIYSAAEGYVSRYEVLSEGVDAASGLYRATIRADVNRRRLEDDIASLKLFQQETGFRRTMLVFRMDEGGVRRGEGPAESALARAGQVLIDKQFHVFDQEALGAIYSRIGATRGNVTDEDLLKAALSQGAEIYVAVRVAGGRKPATGEDSFSGAYATVKLKAYDCTTGRLLGTAEEKAKRIVRRVPSEYDWAQGIGESAAEAAGKAAEDLVPKLVATVRTEDETGVSYQLIFRGFSEDEIDSILDTLEQDPAFKARRVLQKQPGYAEVEVFAMERDTERLGRHLRGEMKKKGVSLETRDLAGSRITFARTP